MAQANFSAAEQAKQVAEEMQLCVIEKHGTLAQQGLYIVIGLMSVFLIWAAFAESDVCAEANGMIEPRIKIQQVKPATDGTVVQYFVREGQAVRAGDVLITLNTTRAAAELKEKQDELSITQNQIKEHENAKRALEKIIENPEHRPACGVDIPEVERIIGELYTAKKSIDAATYDTFGARVLGVSGSDNLPEMTVLREQQKKFESVRQARSRSIEQKTLERIAEKKKLEIRAELLESILEKSHKELAELEKGLAESKKEIEIYNQGKKLGIASEVKFLEVQNCLHQREFSVAQQKQQIAQLEQDLKSARLDLESSSSAYNAEQADLQASLKSEDLRIASVPLSMNNTTRHYEGARAAFAVTLASARARLSKEKAEISSLEKKISEIAIVVKMNGEVLSEKSIKSPRDGTVSDLVQLMPGELVMRGQPLMTIVPADSNLVFRGTINNTDVGFLEVGQEARLRFKAFPCEEFGIVKGKIVRIDDYPEEILEGQKKISAYKVTIEPLQSVITRNEQSFDLKPGLEVHADVVLRRRSVLGLLFEPLLKMGDY